MKFIQQPLSIMFLAKRFVGGTNTWMLRAARTQFESFWVHSSLKIVLNYDTVLMSLWVHALPPV